MTPVTKISAADVHLTPAEKVWLAEHQEVTIAFDGNFPPYSFQNERGQFQGIAVDISQEVAKRVGLKLKVYPDGNWKNLYDAGLKRQVDVIATLTPRPDREQIFAFTRTYISLAQYIVSGKKETPITNREDLAGKTIALVEGYNMTKNILSDFPSVTPLYVEDLTKALLAVSAGKASATVTGIGIAQYLIAKHGFNNLRFSAMYSQGESQQNFGVRNDWPELASIMDKALASMTEDDFIQIFQSWTLPEVARVEGVFSIPSLNLSKEEVLHLKEKRKITMCVSPDAMPYEEINTKGEHVGIAADFLREFTKHFPVPLELVPTKSFQESLERARGNECDLVSMLNESPSRRRYLNFSTPYISDPVVIVTKNDVSYLNGLESLSGKTVGIVEGHVYAEKIRRLYPDVEIVPTETMQDALRKVSTGKVFATVNSLFIVTHYMRELRFTNLIIAGETEIDNTFRIGIQKDDPLLLSIFNKAIDSVSEETRNSIHRRWYSVKFEVGTGWKHFWQAIIISTILICFLGYIAISSRLFSRKLAGANELLQIKTKEAETQARTDYLTGLYNRRAFFDFAKKAEKHASRYNRPYSLSLMDIDHFKSVNDNWGHDVGDQALKAVSKIMVEETRGGDILARFGGEEFILMMPETDLKQARMTIERIRESIENLSFKISGGEIIKLTISCGITCQFSPQINLDEAIIQADKALYRAKNNGRNRVEK